MDLKEQAKNVKESINYKNIELIIDQLILNHTIGEQNFDLEVSNIEKSLSSDINDDSKLKIIKEVNENINNINF